MKYIKIFEKINSSEVFVRDFFINNQDTTQFYDVVKSLKRNNIKNELFYIVSSQGSIYVKIYAYPSEQKRKLFSGSEQRYQSPIYYEFKQIFKSSYNITNWTKMDKKEDVEILFNMEKYNL